MSMSQLLYKELRNNQTHICLLCDGDDSDKGTKVKRRYVTRLRYYLARETNSYWKKITPKYINAGRGPPTWDGNTLQGK